MNLQRSYHKTLALVELLVLSLDGGQSSNDLAVSGHTFQLKWETILLDQ